MVRHGQRIDETQHGKEWRKSAGSRWFDPPLTEEGKEHAIQTATQLQQFLKRHEDDFQPFEKVFCSPLLRTVQTAEQFGAVFNLPVAPSPGAYPARFCPEFCNLRVSRSFVPRHCSYHSRHCYQALQLAPLLSKPVAQNTINYCPPRKFRNWPHKQKLSILIHRTVTLKMKEVVVL